MLSYRGKQSLANPIVREANHQDIDSILGMADNFVDQIEYKDIAPANFKTILNLVEKLIDNDDGFLFVLEQGEDVTGMIGGVFFPIFFNDDTLVGQELFWWVDEEHRGSGNLLLKKAEDHAFNVGAKAFFMMHTENLEPEALRRFYLKNGYSPTEYTYVKRL